MNMLRMQIVSTILMLICKIMHEHVKNASWINNSNAHMQTSIHEHVKNASWINNSNVHMMTIDA